MAREAYSIDEGKLTGAQRAAVILIFLDQSISAKVFSLMEEEEIRGISQAMATLGNVDPMLIENLVKEFMEQLASGAGLVGDLSSTQKLLSAALGEERTSDLLDEIKDPSMRNIWEQLNNVNEELLASYLSNEYSQTAALVLSKLRPSQAARVLSVFADDFALEVMERMIAMEPVKREVLHNIESTLQSEFMSNLSSTKQTDSLEQIAEVFNNFDRSTETKFMDLLDGSDPNSAERIRELMFTFDDLIKIDNVGIQALLRQADNEDLVVALKGANDKLRSLFFENMSERASKIMKEDMESRGPVRMRDVDQAQMSIVTTAKQMAESGELVIPDAEDENEEMVY